MSNRDFNNNINNLSDVYNNQNITNLALSLLPTKLDVTTSINNNNLNYLTTVAINSLLTTTVTNQTNLRDQAITLALTAYTTSLLTATLISNNITSNNLNYLTSTLTNSAISTAISNQAIITNTAINTANTNNTTYTNTKISTEVIDRNNAITANNTLMLSTSKTFSATQVFSNVVVLGSNNAISIGNNTNGGVLAAPTGSQCVSIGCSSSANAYNASALGFQANANGQYCSAYGCNSTAFGSYTTSIGNAAGTNQNLTTQLSNTFIGANTSINGGNWSNSTCIGANSGISASNQITLGTANETVNIPGKLQISTNYLLTYANSLPNFVLNQVGNVPTATKANVAVVSYDAFLNINSIALNPGVYIINFSFQLSTNTVAIPGPIEKGWLAVGLSSSINDLSYINKRMAFITVNTSSFYVSESFFFVANSPMTLFNNIQLLGYESSGVSTRYFVYSQSMSALRVG